LQPLIVLYSDFHHRNEPSGSEWDAVSAASSAPEQSPHIVPARHRPRLSPVAEAFPPKLPAASTSAHVTANDDSEFFKKRRIPAIPLQGKSALTAMLASSTTTANPFAELYGAVSGKGEAASQAIGITVFFPKSLSPSRPMELTVKRDSTIEEVLGFALWNYWEDGWMPKLDSGMEDWADREGDEGDKWKTRMSTVGWIMRIAEEDGEVDEDFPRKYENSRCEAY
jgi:target of rapamycin complex 2 subunit MAPKAP1